MDSSMISSKRSGIPVSTTPTKSRLYRNGSKSTEDNLNISPSSERPEEEMDEFTLIEENISLKEAKKQLINKNLETIQKNINLQNDNNRLAKQLNLVISQKDQLQNELEKFKKNLDDSRKINENSQEQMKKIIRDLMDKNRSHEEKFKQLIHVSHQEIPNGDMSLPPIIKTDDEAFCTEQIDRLLIDIGHLKTHANMTELQLYEANEKNADLIEMNHLLEQEIQHLKSENTNLHKVASVMTNSIRDSVDTSRQWEKAFLNIRKRNDELLEENREYVDSPNSPKFLPTDEVVKLKDELQKKDVAHNERIIEMTKLMENNYNVECEMLQLKLEIIESNLQSALERAEKAEAELERMKKLFENKYESSSYDENCCDDLKLRRQMYNIENKSTNTSPTYIVPQPPTFIIPTTTLPPPPPPPPPPLPPQFNLPPINNHSGTSLTDGIAGLTLRRQQVGAGNLHNQQVKATGMDALIAQIKDGKVTLRKNREKPKQYTTALKEMFEVLEMSNKERRRSSNILKDTQLQMAFSNNNSNNSINI